MKCEFCNFKKTKVTESRTISSNETIRRRKCPSCGKEFWTCESYIEFEEIESYWEEVRKRLNEQSKQAKLRKKGIKKDENGHNSSISK